MSLAQQAISVTLYAHPGAPGGTATFADPGDGQTEVVVSISSPLQAGSAFIGTHQCVDVGEAVVVLNPVVGTESTTVSTQQAGTDDPGILGSLDPEVWGALISQPMADPSNPNFIYQRFQRGILHFDAMTGAA